MLKEISDLCYEGELLSLEHEIDNPYDKNAIKVYYDFDHIGYIKRELAEELASLVDQKRVEAELCEITGGEDGKSYGCNILIRIVPEGEEARTDSREFVHLGSISIRESSKPHTNSLSLRNKKRTGCLTQILSVPILLVLFVLVGSLFSTPDSKNKAEFDPPITENTHTNH